MILKNKRGSALVWAISAMLILLILVSGGLMIASRTSERSFANSFQRQAYLAARSATDIVIDQMQGYSVGVSVKTENGNVVEGSDEGADASTIWSKVSAENPIIPQNIGEPLSLDLQFDAGMDMGEITSATVTRTDETHWEIAVTAMFREVEETVYAELEMLEDEDSQSHTESKGSAGVTFQTIFHGVLVQNLTMNGGTEGARRQLAVNDGNAFILNLTANGSQAKDYRSFVLGGENAGNFYTNSYLVASSDAGYQYGMNDYENSFVGGAAEYYGNLAGGGISFSPNPLKDPQLLDSNGGGMSADAKDVSGTFPAITGQEKTRYFVIVNNNAGKTLDLAKIGDNVEVYVLLANKNSSIRIAGSCGPTSYVYVHGANSTNVIFSGDVNMNGALTCDSVTMNGNVTINYHTPFVKDVTVNFGDDNDGYYDYIQIYSLYYEWVFDRYRQ